MRRVPRPAEGKAATELIEEAIHLLRSAPASALAAYYLGSLPFVLAFLFFWADMSRSPFADQHLAGSALALAGLFFWMKYWQALFARHLRGTLAGAPLPALRAKQAARIFITQATLQPTALFLLPLALVLALPFAWAYAFYQNLTALDLGDTAEVWALVRRAIRQAALWPRQNHVALCVLSAFGLFVFLNWSTVCFLLPGLCKMLFGVESVFSRSAVSLLNTTFFAAMFGLTYLSLDPILKAIYTLRCFYGDSLKSGEDLKADLSQMSSPVQKAAACLFLLLAAGGLAEGAEQSLSEKGISAAPLKEQALSPSVNPQDLDRAIQETIRENKYAWRAPRAKLAESAPEPDGVIARFLERARKTIGEWLKSFGRWLEHWLRKLLSRQPPPQTSGSGYRWILAQEILLYGLIALAAAGLGWLGYKLFRSKRHRAVTIASEPLQPTPDLADENLGPEQLPEDGWGRLARELLTRGEFRLAVRAFYLASLAHLAARNLITLAKFKSNREYERELQRRAHAFPTLLALFDENVSLFERVWYGWHEINAEAVAQFAAKVERLGKDA